MARIYVASSWRNTNQPAIVGLLRDHGHDVYDFRHPPHGDGGFQWSAIDPDWREWSTGEYRDHLLTHPVAARGFLADLRGMMWCDTCVLLLPCGRSAHWEAGWCAGQGKRVIAYLADGEPELMALLATDIVIDDDELVRALGGDHTARCWGSVDHDSVRAVRDALAAVQSEGG